MENKCVCCGASNYVPMIVVLPLGIVVARFVINKSQYFINSNPLDFPYTFKLL